jgi:hypothetical protein
MTNDKDPEVAISKKETTMSSAINFSGSTTPGDLMKALEAITRTAHGITAPKGQHGKKLPD